jgi:hypothetical protein
MEPWFKVATPRKEVREGRSFNPDEFAIALEQVAAGTAPEDYRKPDQFFARTCFTRALREHAGMVLRRLSGKTENTAPVLTLITQFGGGKTHTLTTLYHLANSGEAVRTRYWKKWKASGSTSRLSRRGNWKRESTNKTTGSGCTRTAWKAPYTLPLMRRRLRLWPSPAKGGDPAHHLPTGVGTGATPSESWKIDKTQKPKVTLVIPLTAINAGRKMQRP